MTSERDIGTCIACGNAYVPGMIGFLRCPRCGLLYSRQKAGFGNPIKGMTAIAFRNYAIVANALERVMPLRGAKVLDVGSAEGGFTELIQRKGGVALGLEPDQEAATEALQKRLPVELVSFESFAGREKEYDAIVLNDVFEHMQDPVLSLEKSHKLLKDGGFLLINLPMSSGFVFRMVSAAARLGMQSPYRRIWAQGLSSPHIYFYSEANLTRLLAKYQFQLVDQGRLVAMATEGMYQRVRSTYSPLPALVISAVANLVALTSRIFPADVKYLLFRKK